jgi:acylphosphatase
VAGGESNQQGAAPISACTIVVRGRVQGVNFRSFVAAKARALGLVGWVRNAPDGVTVEACAEGERRALEELARRMREGPPHARVDSVEVSWREPRGGAQGFAIEW